MDAANTRTRMCAIAAGALSRKFVAVFVVISAGVLMLAAWRLNLLAFYLSPVALAVVFLYSFTKRFTRWSHLVLCFAFVISPSAAWIARRAFLQPRRPLLTAHL